MAKTIKFNLILDSHPVRNIESLQEHFSIEDMLKYFENGLLLRWLSVRGYEKEYVKVKSIDKSSKKEIILELLNIFGIDNLSMGTIEESIRILDYKENEIQTLKEYQKNEFERFVIIYDYHNGYDDVITHMENNCNNMAILKADAEIIRTRYLRLFELNHYELYFRLLQSAPKALFALLTKHEFRVKWLGEEANTRIYKSIKEDLLDVTEVKRILGNDLKVVKRDTQAMWDPIERRDVEIMVIYIDRGTFIKNEGEFSEKLSYLDVQNKLLLLKGLEYQCNNSYYELLYMEV